MVVGEAPLGELGEAPTPPPGLSTVVELPKPFARTAMPTTNRAAMITIRAVPRFTRPILPQRSERPPFVYSGMPRRPATRLRRLASRIRRSLRTSMGS